MAEKPENVIVLSICKRCNTSFTVEGEFEATSVLFQIIGFSDVFENRTSF